MLLSQDFSLVLKDSETIGTSRGGLANGAGKRKNPARITRGVPVFTKNVDWTPTAPLLTKAKKEGELSAQGHHGFSLYRHLGWLVKKKLAEENSPQMNSDFLVWSGGYCLFAGLVVGSYGKRWAGG